MLSLGGGHDADLARGVSGRTRVVAQDQRLQLEAFFAFSGAERQLIEQRRDPSLKLGLALQIEFLRMSGRLLDGFRIVPGSLWRYLGAQFNVEAPDLASLRALYRRGNTFFEQQQLACQALGFRGMTEHQRRYLVSMLREGAGAHQRPRSLVVVRAALAL